MSAEPSPKPDRDVGFCIVVAMVVAAAVWLLLIPISSRVAMANMQRFHLANDSFAVWAMHFPLPSMYNFANTFEVDDVPAGITNDLSLEPGPQRYINHFPLRLLTFADARHSYLRSGSHKWVTVTSRYQGQAITTIIHANRVDDSSETLEYAFDRQSGPESTP